jgi:hypothetical protein
MYGRAPRRAHYAALGEIFNRPRLRSPRRHFGLEDG